MSFGQIFGFLWIWKLSQKECWETSQLQSHMYKEKNPFIQIWIVLCCTHNLSLSGVYFVPLHKEKMKTQLQFFILF